MAGAREATNASPRTATTTPIGIRVQPGRLDDERAASQAATSVTGRVQPRPVNR